MTGKGRKKGIKRAEPAKTPISGPTKKQKTSLDNYSPKWHGSGPETMHKDYCMCSKSKFALFSAPPTPGGYSPLS
jgi:hypothetical protein